MSKTEKPQLSAEAMPVLASVVKILAASKKPTEHDVRTLCEMAGVASIAQKDLSPALRQLRESFDDLPKDRLARQADILPESLLLALVMVGDTYISERVHGKFLADRAINEDLQQRVAESEQSSAEFREERDAKTKECERLTASLEASNKALGEFDDRIRTLEKENAIMLGRLTERETQAKKKAAKANRSPTTNKTSGEGTRPAKSKLPKAAQAPAESI